MRVSPSVHFCQPSSHGFFVSWLLVLLLLLVGCSWIPVATAKKKSSSPDIGSRISKCCGITDSETLWDCLKRETRAYSDVILASSSSKKPVEMVVVAYATRNIVSYAAFAMANVALWAESHGYPMRIYESVEGEEAYDPRWNKVPAVVHAITKWANQTQAALWVDADLTVLDVSTTVRDFYKQAPPSKDPHFYICAEHQGSTTYVNSGSYLVKNTEIGREILDVWWNVANRTLLSDQEAFDIMMGGREHVIHVFPPSFFNTDPPAMTNLPHTDRAIHLMGETDPFRKQVFQAAFAESCRAHEQHLEPAHQLGITKSFLLETALTVHEVEYNQILQDTHPVDASNLETFTEKLTRVSHLLSHAMHHSGKERRAIEIKCEVYRRLSDVVDRYRSRNDLESVRRKLSAGIGCMGTMESLEDVERTYRSLREDLAYLQKHVHRVQAGNVILGEVRLEEAMTMHYIQRQMWELALEKQIAVVTLLTRNNFPKHNLMNPWATLTSLLCTTGKNVLSFPFFEEMIAIRIQRLGPKHSSLAVDYFNMGVCKYEALMFEQALQDLKKSLDIMDENNFPSTDDTRLRAATYYKKASDVIQQLRKPQPVQKSNRYYHDDIITDEL
jgi:hypothetical protein